MLSMRRVERPVIDHWIEQNGPDGVSRLAVESGVSASTINKLRGGRAPVRASTRLAICRVLKVEEGLLFPLIGVSGGEAS